MRTLLQALCLLLSGTVMAAPLPGLIATYHVDRDGDGLEETAVCGDPAPWEDVAVRESSISMRYNHPSTPCAEIDMYERWRVDYSGLFRIVTEGSFEVPLDFTADVNDGLRLLVRDRSGTDVCAIDFWRDVPRRWNYQSTDATDVDMEDLCDVPLRSNELYQIDISVYHQSETRARSLHNRAYLALYFDNVRQTNGHIEFFHSSGSGMEVESLSLDTQARDGGTQLDVSMRLFTHETVDVALLRESVLQCLEF